MERKHNLEYVSKMYLENFDNRALKDGLLEMEIRFGTKRNFVISQIDYNNVIKKLKNMGFRLDPPMEMLRISHIHKGLNDKREKKSDIRTTISGLHEISKYCKTNMINSKAKFEDKRNYVTNDGTVVNTVDIDEYGFRISLSVEKDLDETNEKVSNLTANWNETGKKFRYLSRTKLTHDDFPVAVDMSIVKSSTKSEYTIQESGVFETEKQYEIEIEVDSTRIESKFNKQGTLSNAIRTVVKYILCGIQRSNYPISNSETRNIHSEYMSILRGTSDVKQAPYPSDFVGPSSNTLQISNILNNISDTPNIRNSYTATDKADGDRKLLFINNIGRIYLIDTNMQVEFTGAVTDNAEVFSTIIDGEHILHDKEGRYINMYGAFDIYYIKKKDVRNLSFKSVLQESDKTKYRLCILKSVIKQIKPKKSHNNSEESPINIFTKKFEFGEIFAQCKNIIDKINDGLYPYETDGLIFTPTILGVGANSVDEEYKVKPKKMTWKHSFKWKPAANNTIDFLTTFEKNASGQLVIGNILDTSTNVKKETQIQQYMVAALRVGYDQKKHGYIDPCSHILNDSLPDQDIGSNGYRPVRFHPSNPPDDNAGVCHIMMTSPEQLMYTEEKEIIEDNTIIEYRYDHTRKSKWRWIPLRVRYDKTADFRLRGNNFGNAYHVANSNWESIHNPITEIMITTGTNIPNEGQDDDIYYNPDGKKSVTLGLREFHNKFVKHILITSVSNPGNTMIDLAVGKGGDLPKWVDSKLGFILGIDISRDNIENNNNGVCSRYLDYKKKIRHIPRALFVQGNSTRNIVSTDAFNDMKTKQIIESIFGKNTKQDAEKLGQGVLKNHGVASDGFDICSIQFAIHYMFESLETLCSFIQNVSETTKKGGYFIGTSYDGDIVFKYLSKVKKGESFSLTDPTSKRKVWEVTKQYDANKFGKDQTSLGYKIDIYQESINNTVSEYLVNYGYLKRILENYGFKEYTDITENDEKVQQLKNTFKGKTHFKDLQTIMRQQSEPSRYRKVPKMSVEEQIISRMNRMFIYKKLRTVDAAAVTNSILQI